MKVNYVAPTEIKEKIAATTDPLILGLINKTPAEVAAWIDTHVTDLASAKEVLKAFGKVISYLVKFDKL